MDDYYAIIGVDAGATTDDIRSAYREKKDALSTIDGGTSKSDAAKLNKAWNVLSDPYQRGRYDEQRAQALEDDVEIVDDDEPVVAATSNGAKRPAAGATKQNPRQRPPLVPTITPPAGTHFPKPKQRIIAMVIDLVVIFVLFAGSQALTVAFQKNMHPGAYNAKTQLTNHTVPDAQKALDNAKKARDNANKGTDQAAKDKAQTDVNNAQATLDKANKELDSANSRLAPVSRYTRQAPVVMVKPGGTGRPRLVISARFAPFPPSRYFCSFEPSSKA